MGQILRWGSLQLCQSLINGLLTDSDDNSDLVADVNPDTLSYSMIQQHSQEGNTYRFLQTLARAFTISLKLSYVGKIAVLCMLVKPDKPSSQTTS